MLRFVLPRNTDNLRASINPLVMAQVELIMPKMGESIMEATVLSWLKKPGDKIEAEESILEVATDKVDTEVPSTHGGVLKEILAKEGEVVKVGNPIALIETESEVDFVNDTPSDQPVGEQIVEEGELVVEEPAFNGNKETK